ncbi:hypothetical protein BH10BAC6_BH10BAC6_07310 [soil metagenome]
MTVFNLTTNKQQRQTLSTIFVITGIVLLVARMVVVTFWAVYGGHTLTDTFMVEVVLTIVSDLILLCVIGVVFLYYTRRISRDVSYEVLAGALTTYAISALALLLLGALLPSDVVDGIPTNILTVVTSHVLALGTFIVSIGLAGFLVWFLQMRRHERTGRYLILLTIILFGVWLLSALGSIDDLFSGLSIILVVIGSIVMLMSIKRLNWLATLTMDKKIRLLWLTTCAAFAAGLLASWHAFNNDAFVTQSAAMFVRSGAILPSAINLFGFVFFARLFFAVLASLPNSGIVDRRSSEVESLARLTRMMAETADVDTLLASVTQFALHVCRAHGAWCELYDEDGSIRVVASKNVHADYVTMLHQDRDLHRLFIESARPVLTESLADTLGADGTLPIRSVITVPLIREQRRTGTLVMFSTIEYGFEADDLQLLTAFGDTISIALDQTRLMEMAIEKERLQKEFDVARRIQSSLLPVAHPDIPSLDVAAITIPAEEIGGDYHDYVRFANGRPGVIIADVSGKGIPAALYMATLKGVVLAEMRSSHGPADLLCRANAALIGSMEKQTYITMMAVEFDAQTMTMRMARAGHTPLLLRSGTTIRTYTPKGIAIGLVPSKTFDAVTEEIEFSVAPNDIVMLTTDGVNERRDANLEEIGIEPVCDMLAGLGTATASAIIAKTLDLLNTHGNGTDQHDDITIVSMVFAGDNETTTEDERIQQIYGVLS